MNNERHFRSSRHKQHTWSSTSHKHNLKPMSHSMSHSQILLAITFVSFTVFTSISHALACSSLFHGRRTAILHFSQPIGKAFFSNIVYRNCFQFAIDERVHIMYMMSNGKEGFPVYRLNPCKLSFFIFMQYISFQPV